MYIFCTCIIHLSLPLLSFLPLPLPFHPPTFPSFIFSSLPSYPALFPNFSIPSLTIPLTLPPSPYLSFVYPIPFLSCLPSTNRRSASMPSAAAVPRRLRALVRCAERPNRSLRMPLWGTSLSVTMVVVAMTTRDA